MQNTGTFLHLRTANAVGCGRLTAQGQIGRMAVLPTPNQGIGAALLHNIVTAAHDAGTDRIFTCSEGC